jgi:hypothetical protein
MNPSFDDHQATAGARPERPVLISNPLLFVSFASAMSKSMPTV